MRFSTIYVWLLLVLSGCWFTSNKEVCEHDLRVLGADEISGECRDMLGLTAESDADTDSDSDTDSDTDADTDSDTDGDTDTDSGLPTADTGNGDVDHTGLIDDTFTTDNDDDGYCEAGIVCTDGSTPGDCDDTEPAAYPGAPEVCDEIDNDCVGGVDNGLVIPTWYRDLDHDGHGAPAFSTQACEAPTDYVAFGDDCLDTDINTFTGAALLDNPAACMTDADGDDWGDDAPVAGVVAGDDCDDTNPGANPDEFEVCDPANVDEDCNNLSDDIDPNVDPATFNVYCRDVDGDGVPGGAVQQQKCDPTVNFYVCVPQDSDDNNPYVQ